MPASLEYVNDGDWARVRLNTDTTSRLLNPPVPQARVYNDANVSVANSSVVAVTFNQERYDSGGLHSTSSNTSRLTAPITGLYRIGATVRFAGNATGVREAQIRVDGATFIDYRNQTAPHATQPTILGLGTDYQLTAGQYVEVTVFQNSGGALNVEAATAYSPEFWMHRVAGFVNQGV